jgi:hypothetical protein
VWEFARLGGGDILSTAIIVGEANPLVGAVGPTTSTDDLKDLFKPYDPALMEAYAVNSAVNSVKNDTEECIDPATGGKADKARTRQYVR